MRSTAHQKSVNGLPLFGTGYAGRIIVHPPPADPHAELGYQARPRRADLPDDFLVGDPALQETASDEYIDQVFRALHEFLNA
jgi:hypothetical protein